MVAHLFIPEDPNPGARPSTAFPGYHNAPAPGAIATTVHCPGESGNNPDPAPTPLRVEDKHQDRRRVSYQSDNLESLQ